MHLIVKSCLTTLSNEYRRSQGRDAIPAEPLQLSEVVRPEHRRPLHGPRHLHRLPPPRPRPRDALRDAHGHSWCQARLLFHWSVG